MPHSIYLHIPFCTHRCAYCDFNTYAGVSQLMPAYVESLCREVELVGRQAPRDVMMHTVFFGGGTPSLLSARLVAQILDRLGNTFHITPDAEVTLEANPGTTDRQALQEMRRAGVNRLSLGVQSANGEELRALERTHDFGDVLRAVADARRAGFNNLNLDLIYGLPEQSLATWETSLRRILELQPEHISAYCLTLEHGTPLGQWSRRGLIRMPDPDVAAEMYEFAERELERAGYEHYEISNWARPGRRSRHNVQYWAGEPYLGFGAGAHGYAAGCRYSNVLAIREYVARVNEVPDGSNATSGAGKSPQPSSGDRTSIYPCSPAAVTRHAQTSADDMAEFMIMGLRLTTDGVSGLTFASKFGVDVDEVYGPPLAKLTDLGLLETVDHATPEKGAHASPTELKSERRIRLTSRGRLLGNRVFQEFVN
ncbi:MAG TPA: radical SAM family heme chaperone HemW [Anaerolineales bacterium]|nr:radical SAM family heme chaperone HemW [Anaerolineales bacterium]